MLSSIVSVPGPYSVEVVLKTSLERAREVISPDLGALEPTEQGLIFRRTTMYLEWVADWLMKLDFPVFVIQPMELREMLRQVAAKALQMVSEEMYGRMFIYRLSKALTIPS